MVTRAPCNVGRPCLLDVWPLSSQRDPAILNPTQACSVSGQCRLLAMQEGSPVAVMPDPRVAAVLGSEVGLPVVVDLGGEAQKASVACGGVGLGGRG